MVHLQLIKDEALINHIPIMKDETLEFINDLIKQYQINDILEIGSATGYSSIFLATYNHILIDTLEKDEIRFDQALINISKSKLQGTINIKHLDALEYCPSEQYDLIIIDAAKAKNLDFFAKFSPFLKEDGFIVTDNIGLSVMDGKFITRNRQRLIDKTQEYTEYLINHPDFITTFYEIGDKIAVSKRK